MNTILLTFATALFVASVSLGAFFVGSAGLTVSQSGMRVAWLAYAATVALAVGLAVLAIRRRSTAALIVAGIAPVPFALLVSAASLRLLIQ
jgi:anti-sigma-K factor RskA